MSHTHTHPTYLPNYFQIAISTNKRNKLFYSYEIITFLCKQLDGSYITPKGSKDYVETTKMSV